MSGLAPTPSHPRVQLTPTLLPMLPTALLAAAALLSGSVFGEESWNYDQQGDDWPGLCANGRQQSPININTSLLITPPDAYPLYFFNYHRTTKFKVEIIHYSLKVSPVADYKLSISGGGLPGNYVFDHLHFHWPGEHTVNGARPIMEGHFVHRKDIYNTTEEAAQDPEGIAVLGVLYTCKKSWLQQFLKSLKKKFKPTKFYGSKGRGIFFPKPWNHIKTFIKKEGKENYQLFKIEAAARNATPYCYLNFEKMLPYDKSEFYRYKGSLTTPGCAESVIWTVFKNYVSASTFQVAAFRGLMPENEQLDDTYRNTKLLYGRKVELWSPSVRSLDSNRVHPLHANPSILFAVLPGLSNSIQFPHFIKKYV